MICKNCGSETPDAPFCKVCGARLDSENNPLPESEVHEEQHNQNNINVSDTDPVNFTDDTAAPKKSFKKPLIIGTAAAAVLIIGGICIAFASSISGFFRKTFSAPEDYYRYVEMNALKNGAEAFSDTYDTYLENAEKIKNSCHMDFSLKLEDGARSLLGTVIPADITWLKEVSLKMDSKSEESSSSSEMALYLNDSKLLTFQEASDLELQKIYLKFPELSDSYLLMDLAEILESAGTDLASSLELSGMTLQLSDYCPDGETAAEILNRYGELIYKNITEVEKEKTTLEVDGLSQKCTSLEATIKPAELTKIGQDVIEQLKEDKDIEKIIRAFADDAQNLDPYGDIPDADTLYQEFTASLDEAMEELNDPEEADDYYILSKIWIGNGSQIIGRDFSLVSDGETERILHYARPQKKNDFALEADLSADGSTMAITGSGQISSNKENGTYTFFMDDTPMFTVEVEDYDLKVSKDGSSGGSLLFRPCSGLMGLMEIETGAEENEGMNLLSNYSLKVSFDHSKDSSKADITVLSVDVPMFTITSAMEFSDNVPSNLPKDSDTVYDMMDEEEFMDYMMSINWDELLNALKSSDLPSEYTEIIESGIRELQASLEFYSQYY